MKIKNKALLLFPPNWSACVSGPHLALPLISGAIKELNIYAETWDLSTDFYKTFGGRPAQNDLLTAVKVKDFDTLYNLYFYWEDKLRELGQHFDSNFSLLSGFEPKRKISTIYKFLKQLNEYSVFTQYFEAVLESKLIEFNPSLIGISVSSQNQIYSALQLILFLKKKLPKTKLIIGGNVITRLRSSKLFYFIREIVDIIVIYQGEAAVKLYIDSICLPEKNTQCSKITGNELIPYQAWPLPNFDGIKLSDYIGVQNISYVSTRGCYWSKCSFCAIPHGWSSTGYAGSAPAVYFVKQLEQIISETRCKKVKFVDETFPPSKVYSLSYEINKAKLSILWEAYARVDKTWENEIVLIHAKESGCCKLYFGLELSPEANRHPLNKNDKGDIVKIMELCKKIGISVHLFCMVGHPQTNYKDAELTVKFLIEHQELVDTADLVGFRLDRGVSVYGVEPYKNNVDWALSQKYKRLNKNILSFEQVRKLEIECQETLWDNVPRLLHPLYRIGKEWSN